MRLLNKIFWILILFWFIIFIPKALFAQKKSSYNIEFVHAVQYGSDDNNHILTVFKVTPTIKKFKLILSMKVTYEIGKEEKIVDIQKQQENNIRISIYGKTLPEKNPKLYEMIKGKINLETKEDISFIIFDFFNVTIEQIDKMSITYGLWESNNQNVRNEKRFDFNVEQIEL